MSESGALDTPGLARRIATARTVSGREIDELASLLGISFEAYEDLERFDDEAVDVISFDQLVLLISSSPARRPALIRRAGARTPFVRRAGVAARAAACERRDRFGSARKSRLGTARSSG